MYKVMIVDDERFIRKSIRNRIAWEQYGLSVEAEASNGQEALKLLEELRPEVILADIRMPVMDGLAFIEEAQKILPKSCYIIMSAYSDFSYAQQGIRLGVESYILKPVDEEELGGMLERAVHRLNQMQLNRHAIGWKAGQEGFSLRFAAFAAVAFWYPFLEEDPGFGQKAERLLEQHAYIQGKGMEQYRLEGYSRENCLVYIINGEQLSEDGIRRMLKDIMAQLPEEAVVSYTDVRQSARGIYDVAARESQGSWPLLEAAAASVAILKEKLFCPGVQVISPCRKEGKRMGERRAEARDKISRVYHSLQEGECGKACRELIVIANRMIQRENSIQNIEEAINDSLLMLEHFLGGEGGIEFGILAHKFRSQDYLLEYSSPDKLKDDWKELVEQCAAVLGIQGQQDSISAMKAYIRENYAEDLNTSHIAQKFFLNASYLSALFKEKTGIRLSAYIEGVRMEKAKAILESGAQNVTEAAMQVGYSDAGYFSKVFKKYTGMTPKQYRDRF